MTNNTLDFRRYGEKMFERLPQKYGSDGEISDAYMRWKEKQQFERDNADDLLDLRRDIDEYYIRES